MSNIVHIFEKISRKYYIIFEQITSVGQRCDNSPKMSHVFWNCPKTLVYLLESTVFWGNFLKTQTKSQNQKSKVLWQNLNYVPQIQDYLTTTPHRFVTTLQQHPSDSGQLLDNAPSFWDNFVSNRISLNQINCGFKIDLKNAKVDHCHAWQSFPSLQYKKKLFIEMLLQRMSLKNRKND